MDKYIGRLLDGRYEILEEIGRGGMAVVYRARCHRLNRYVAVKILKEELSRDEDFRRRFHAESQAVAMLSHPNIVAVYDVNHSNDADYIVMELIDGLTLKQYMQQRGVLSWREALHFATQIAKALEHAHGRGIVHRDIKPHNIMILKDGSVKVADFGIARLSSSQNTLTREALGSVHYISPEQAKGAQVDARSDLYSLGVVMYEMLTGKPPYDGESPVAIAIQHINSTPTPPRQISPNIPLGLQQITLHAMCSDLSARYSSATAMIEDLEALRKNPQVVFRFNAGPGGTTAYVDSRQVAQPQSSQKPAQPVRTAAAGAAGAAVGAAAGAAAANGQRPAQNRPVQNRPVQQRPAQNRTPDPQQAARQKARSMAERSVQRAGNKQQSYEDDVYYDDEEETRSNKPLIITVVVLLLVLIAAGVFLLRPLLMGSSSDMIEVPNFLGENIDDVLSNVLYEDFNLIRGDSVYSDKYAEDEICEQSLPQGKRVQKGVTIELTVSKGAQTESMPNLVGQTQQTADSTLNALEMGLSVEYVYEESDTVEKDRIISTDPVAGAMLTTGQSIRITISAGKGVVMTTVPDVIGLEKADAIAELRRFNLEASVTEVENDEDEGLVFYQSMKKGAEVPEGTTVSIKVSLGRPEPSPSPSPSEEPETPPPTETPPTESPSPPPSQEPPSEPPTTPSAPSPSQEPPSEPPAETSPVPEA